MGERQGDEPSTLLASEYDFLRKEVATSLEEIRSLERTALAVTGAIWAWLLTNPPVTPLAWGLPPVLVALAAYRAHTLNDSFQLIATYIANRERDLLPKLAVPSLDDVHGWETFRRKQNAGVERSAVIFWAVLLLVSLGGALVLHGSVRPPKDPSPPIVKVPCGQPSQK